ncbi:MAG: hypothetical protein IKL84_02330 [Clostridia bacterium]|nr:hypothetical protein [Clostridia bacterium]
MAEVVYKRRFGDRKEGRQLRSLSPFNKFIPYIMVKKNDACNQFADSLEISDAEKWFREKRLEGWKGMGMLHLFIAAYLRTVSQCPGLNRFIGGQKIFARRNIEVVLTVKRALTVDADETTIKVYFEPTDTIFDVYRKMNEKIGEIKANDGENNTEQVAGALTKIPGLILKFAVWLLNLLDYFDLLPQALLNASPFHGSMIITDLGSIGIPPIYHHLYNFGNLPLFIAFGAKRRVMELDKAGVPTECKYVDYKVVMDERIADGSYYAMAFKHLKHYLKNPALLETAPESVKEDVF